MGMSFTFNQIQQVIDACAKFMKDPENFIINNHIHDVFSIRGLPEALDDKVSNDVFYLHLRNQEIHITDEERIRWNGMLDTIKEYVNEKFAGITGVEIVMIPDGSTHTSIKNPSAHAIYFEKNKSPSGSNIFDEYMYVDGSWELVGDTDIDLSNYYTKEILYTKNELYSKEEIDKKFDAFIEKYNKHIVDSVAHLSKAEHEKLTNLIEEEKIIECDTHLNFPSVGKVKTIYIARKENATYRWDDDNMKYYCTGRDYEAIEVIDGGKSEEDE